MHIVSRVTALPAVLLAAFLPAPAAHAQAPATSLQGAGVGVTVGTLGLGLEGTKQVNPLLAVRVGVNGYSYSHDATYQDIDYKGKLRLQSVSLLGDVAVNPRSAFHLVGGLVFNSNKITANAQANSQGKITLNGTDYNLSDVGALDGKVTFTSASPYLGLRLGALGSSAGGHGLHIFGDLGVMFQGKPKLSLNRSGGTTDPTLSAQINSDIAVQRGKTQHDVDKFQYYPVLTLGLSYGL